MHPKLCILTRRSSSGDGDQIADVVASSRRVPENCVPEDFHRFLNLIDSESPEEVQRKAISLMESGELTEGVLEAAFATLEQAKEKDREGTDDGKNVVASLQVREAFYPHRKRLQFFHASLSS